MRRRGLTFDVSGLSMTTLRTARDVFAPLGSLFADLVGAIDLEITLRELPFIAIELGGHVVAAPAEVA